ncbi:WD40 domain-containing protein [Oryctes borbonicus]|uniref:tRNA (34-2'-O)-methyltransferase regulator WDR6 n=1 Tax=Oryctes borbonicus TaxID=1629725 RepID=A0A0T6AT89_9SCAR|nr:WD40 domain-containing protein [Oryctes borbonicus]
MHNVVTLLNCTLSVIMDKECMERCISYCAQMANDHWNDLIVLSGTVFSQILIWWPRNCADKLCPVLYRLIGHKGVIFSIDYNPTLNIICSASDDRTAKVWAIKSETLAKEIAENPISINLKYTLIGHTARVFKCKIFSDSIITAGEDGIINIWDKYGELIKKSDVHQGGPVWSLDCCEDTNTIVSGGGDCGVFKFKLRTNVLKSSLETELDNPKKVLIFSSDNVAYLTDDGLFLMYKRKAQQFAGFAIHEDLKSYGLLEKSPCGCRIALAGYHGTIHLYQVVPRWLDYMYSCQIESKERIYSMHWLSCKMLLTCGVKGILTLWTVGETTMMPIHFWELPRSKERWSTAACFCGINTVLVGDRRGTLYVYSTDSSQPVQIIKKAHNYLGISAMYFRNGKVISLGNI